MKLRLSLLAALAALPVHAEPAADADKIMEAALKNGPFPGASVAVEQHGKVVYSKAFGMADLEKKTPVTTTTRFPIGSITKSFTCLSIQQLADKGAVDITKPAGTYLPDLPEPDKSVKLVNLLTHTSGIPNYTDNHDFPMKNPTGLTRQQVISYFDTKPLQFESGSRFNYTNSGTYLLGLVVESVAKQSYDQYVTDHVLKPFGMTSTGFDAHDDGAANRARGYKLGKNGFEPAPVYDFEIPFSAGAIVSTAGDLLKYREGVFGPKTAESVRKRVLTHINFSNGQPLAYMLGCLVEARLDGHRKYAHAGDIFGFAADYAYYPDDDLTIAILTNNQSSSFPPVSIEHKLARAFLGIPAPKLVDQPVPAELGEKLAGNYRAGMMSFGFDAVGINYKDGKAALTIGGLNSGGPTLPLRYQGNERFVSAVDDEHVMTFSSQADGSIKLVMDFYDGQIDFKK